MQKRESCLASGESFGWVGGAEKEGGIDSIRFFAGVNPVAVDVNWFA